MIKRHILLPQPLPDGQFIYIPVEIGENPAIGLVTFLAIIAGMLMIPVALIWVLL